MSRRRRGLAAAASVTVLAVVLGAAAWRVPGSGGLGTVTAAHLDAGVPSATAIEGGVTLTWPPGSPPPDQWQIVRATSASGPWTVIATLPGTATTYTDPTPGGPFYYEVRPVVAAWTGTTVPTNSPAPTAVTPLPTIHLPISDAFTKNGSDTTLGTTQVGNQPWEALNSTLASWTRNGTSSASSYASTTAPAASNPMIVTDTGTPDVAVVLRVQSVGDAIYLRVTDPTHWLRLRLNETQSGSAPVTLWRWVWPGYGGTGYPSSAAATAACMSATGGSETDCYNSTYSYDVGGYTYDFRLVLESDAAGTITSLGSWSVGSSKPEYMALTADGTALAVRYGGSQGVATVAGSATSGVNQGATRQGVGVVSSSYGVSTGVGAVTLTSP